MSENIEVDQCGSSQNTASTPLSVPARETAVTVSPVAGDARKTKAAMELCRRHFLMSRLGSLCVAVKISDPMGLIR